MQMWKQNRTLFEYFRFMGYLMMIVGVYLLVGGIGDYAEQSRQNDWISTEATVTDVSSEVVSSSPPHSRSTTYYILAYAYVVDGEIYTGSTGRTSSPRMVGTAITVKYNPGAPEENTATLSPNTHNLVVLLIFGTAIAVAGFFNGHCKNPGEAVGPPTCGLAPCVRRRCPFREILSHVGSCGLG